MKRVLRLLLALGIAMLIFCGGWAVGRLGLWSQVDRMSLAPPEKEFAERMSPSALRGTFTIDGRDGPGRPDRYDISSVTKVGEDLWRFDVRIRYGDNDVTVPVTTPMRWVGDTPIIQMTDYAIPGLGTFSARVFFHGDRYAGTWQHGPVGGHMTGKIENGAAP